MNWTEKSLDELGFVSRGKSRHRPRDAVHLYGGAYPFVQTGDVKHAGLYLSNYKQTYSDAGLAQSKLWPKGTLCITIAANIADTSILDIEACFPDSVIGFIPEPEKADARFIKYLFDAKLKLAYSQFTQGAAQENLSQGKLLSIKFSIPNDVNDQTRIADFAAQYDNLIENNKRRIQLLEESARLLYKEWFVHLRFPGHEHIKVTDGVPEGWVRKELGSFVGFWNGKKSRKSQNGVFPIYGANGIIGMSNEAKYENAVIIGRVGAYCGAVEYCFDKFWGSDNTIIAKCKTGKYVPYLFLMLYFYNLNSYAGGAAQPLLTQSSLTRLPYIQPPISLIEIFDSIVADTYRGIDCLIKENMKLVVARDILLPRLINGELTV